MPTKHRRIAVTEDPELAAVLEQAADALPGLSSSALVRELAIRGAAVLRSSSDINPKLKALLDIPGVQPGTGNLREYLDQRGPFQTREGADPYRGTKALEEQREERL